MATKTIVYAFLFFVSHLSVSGQTYVGVRAGANFFKADWKSFGTRYKTKFTPGYHFGTVVTTPLQISKRQLFVQPGLFFTTKGYSEDYVDEVYGDATFTASPQYLEVPLNFLYLVPSRNDKNIFVGFGPYAALGIGGQWDIKLKPKGRFVGDLEYVDLTAQDDEDEKFNYGRKLDYGVNVLLGYELFDRIQVQLNGQIGLRNIAPLNNKKTTGETFRNMGIGLSVGYTFE
mgnify:CR=1 FL=1